MNEITKQLIDNLVIELNYATEAYDAGQPLMSDQEWDNKYFELLHLEVISGYTNPNSPTQVIRPSDYVALNKLSKVEHNHKMLSLAKTKDIKEIESFLGGKEWIAMLKMDGLTCSLTYEDGKLVRAETRGNGFIGEDITHCAKMVSSIPKRIKCKKKQIIDGEVICRYNDFEPFKNEYSNPRNFAAGSIRQLDNAESRKRNLTFVAWDFITPSEERLSKNLDALQDLGFITVPYFTSENGCSIEEVIEELKSLATGGSYPIDGVVFKYNYNPDYFNAGETAHHFNGGLAYKFYDETYDTMLLDIEYDVSRRGMLTPVAVFSPIDIDGAIISRANLFNISTMNKILKRPFIGQPLEVFRANQIIPQVKWGGDPSDDKAIFIEEIPTKCPVCGGEVECKDNNGVITAYCGNSTCPRKIINIIDHYASKKGMDIKGLSKATLEKIIDFGWVDNIQDIYTLKEHRNEWIKKPGFGVKSVDRVLESIEESRHRTLFQFISALGIPLVGQNVAKLLCANVENFMDFRNKITENWDFATIPTIGENMDAAIKNFDYAEADEIYKKYLTLDNARQEHSNQLEGLIVCITGKLKHYKTRDLLKQQIEIMGGKVTNSVTSKTSYLINNEDKGSAKSVKAAELGVEVITEEEFLRKFIDN